jgi:hypothetical protein
MELLQQQRSPDPLFLLIESIPCHQNFQIGKRWRILQRDPERKIVEEVQMHEMVLVPVAEPDHFDLLFGAETEEPFPARCGVDQDTRTFDIDGVAEGIATPVFTGEKTDRTKSAIFHRHLLGKIEREMAEPFATRRDYRKEMLDLSSKTRRLFP